VSLTCETTNVKTLLLTLYYRTSVGYRVFLTIYIFTTPSINLGIAK